MECIPTTLPTYLMYPPYVYSIRIVRIYVHNNNNLALSPFILRILTNCRYVYNSYPYAHNFFSISPTSSSSYLTPPLSVIIFQISSLSSHLAILSQLCFAASSFTKPRQSPSAAAAVHTQESSSCITPKFISPNPSCATQRELAGRYTSPQRLISSQNERRTIIYIYIYIHCHLLCRGSTHHNSSELSVHPSCAATTKRRQAHSQ